MMKMKFAAIMAAVMIGSVTLPAVTAYAQGDDPAQTVTETTAAEQAGSETKETVAPADLPGETTAEKPESAAKQNDEETAGGDETTEDNDGTASDTEESGSSLDLSTLDLSGIPGMNLDVYADILSDLDPEVIEVLLKNPKLLAYFLPTLHVAVTDNAVTIAVDGSEAETEADPVQTGHVRTNGSNLNVRTGPGIDHEIINKLANGTEVQVSHEENGWYQLVFPAKYGYVCGQYLELNDIVPAETPEGYTFDIDGEMLASFLSLFSGLFEEEPQPVPEVHGLTPDGNLTLVDDIGPVTGEGQQFVTLVTKAGNYFYLIIDRDEKGEETVHFLNLVDERDLFTLMEEDEQEAYNEKLAAEQAAKEAAEKAAAEAAEKANEDAKGADKDKDSGKKTNMLPLILLPLLLAGVGGGWFYLQTKKKKQAANTPDPDADYTDDDDEEDYAAGDESGVSDSDNGSDGNSDPYEDEILGDSDDYTDVADDTEDL